MFSRSTTAKLVASLCALAIIETIWWICYNYMPGEDFTVIVWIFSPFFVAPTIALIYLLVTDDVERDHVVVLGRSGRILGEGFHVHPLDYSISPPLPKDPSLYKLSILNNQVSTVTQTYKTKLFTANPDLLVRLAVDFLVADPRTFVRSNQHPYGKLEVVAHNLALEALKDQTELNIESLNAELENVGLQASRFAIVQRFQRIEV